jgi:hypothetical protein
VRRRLPQSGFYRAEEAEKVRRHGSRPRFDGKRRGKLAGLAQDGGTHSRNMYKVGEAQQGAAGRSRAQEGGAGAGQVRGKEAGRGLTAARREKLAGLAQDGGTHSRNVYNKVEAQEGAGWAPPSPPVLFVWPRNATPQL